MRTRIFCLPYGYRRTLKKDTLSVIIKAQQLEAIKRCKPNLSPVKQA